MRTGVIGLGQIGSGIALCLARAGQLSAVYDVRSDASDQLQGVPPVAASPAEVAKVSDVIVIAVVSAAQTIDVLSGEQGLLAAARPGQSIILVATVSLEDLDRIRALTDAAGVALIDSGVVGGLHAAKNGLICLVGAEDEVLKRAMPAFEGFVRYVAHLGGPGAGMAGKVIYNGIYAASLRAGRDGETLAKAVGVDARALEQVFKDSAESVGGPLRFVAATDPGSSPTEAARRREMSVMMKKDLDAALALARANGVKLPVVEYTRETVLEVIGIA
jgi:3-hydroxyisobutyrate dehydrogenase